MLILNMDGLLFVRLFMKTKLPQILFALLLCPVVANSEPTTHIIEDPNPQTIGCQNHLSAVHKNGDIVSVFYHGQWATWEMGSGTRESQNGGKDGSQCGLEAIVRVRENGEVAWELSPDDDSREEIGIAKQDQIRSLNTFPDGRTLITTTADSSTESMSSMVIMLDANGGLLWKKETAIAPRFSLAKTFIGSQGQLFVSYSFTNFGYKNGILKLDSGKKWTIGKNKNRTIVAKIDPETGDLEWEKEMELFSAKGNELLAVKIQYRKTKSRITAQRFSYEGKRKSRFSSPWMRGNLNDITPFNQDLAILQTVEVLNKSRNRVDHRFAKLYVLNPKGKLILQKKVSDNAVFAKRLPGAPLRIVSPLKLIRDKTLSRTRAMRVYTFTNVKTPPKVTSISIDSGSFSYDHFSATSTPDAIWVHARSYFGNEKRPAVSSILTADSESQSSIDKVYPWKPIPKKAFKKIESFKGFGGL